MTKKKTSKEESLIVNNSFTEAGGLWHTIMDRSGYRNIYRENNFENCDRFEDGVSVSL